MADKRKLYQYYQPNAKDLKDYYGDCVIRALTKVMNKSWMEVFNEMLPICSEFQALHNNKVVYETYLKNNRFTYTGISNKKGTKRPTVESFTKEHKTGMHFVILANHVVAVVDGQYFDTWDCGEKSLYGYWSKE